MIDKVVTGAVGLAALGAALMCCTLPAKAYVRVGDTVTVLIGCDKDAITELILATEISGRYGEADKKFQSHIAQRRCYTTPGPMPARVEEIGYASKVFIDEDGDAVRITAAKILGTDLWAPIFEIVRRGAKA